MTITRRALGGLALGAVSAGALRAQEAGDPCETRREWGNWEATAYYYDAIDEDYYTYVLRHKASGISFRFESTDPGRVMDAPVQVGGFSKIYNDVEWFLDDVTENAGRSLEVTLSDPATGFTWEVRGRAVRATDSFDFEPYGAVQLDISAAKAQELFDYMSRFETQVSADAKLILSDGARYSASTWKMTTDGLGVLDGGAKEMFREISARVSPGTCTGSCFLTTSCCEAFGRPDDGLELRTLRDFRDGWLVHQPGGAEEVAAYYRIAPPICAALAADPMGRWELARTYLGTILPCVALIRLGFNGTARALYRRLVRRLQARYPVAVA